MNMNIYLSKNNKRHGPFAIEQVREMIQKGEFMMSNLAWHEGMNAWQPIYTLPDMVKSVLPPIPENSEATNAKPSLPPVISSSTDSNQQKLAIAVPPSRFTLQIRRGLAFFVRPLRMHDILYCVVYCVGILVIVLGIAGIGTDIELATSSTVRVAKCSFDVTNMIWGILICVVTWFRYRGGLWFLCGALLAGFALVGTVSIVEAHLRGWHFDSPVTFYIKTASFWLVGVASLVIGQRRHRRKNRDEIREAKHLSSPIRGECL
jgi:hypothetical protein